MNKSLKYKLTLISLVLPGMFLFLLAVFVPIILSLYNGMTDMEGMSRTQNFIGLRNYYDIIVNDSTFRKSLLNALLLGIGYVVLQHPFCIAFAIMLDRMGGKGEKFFRTILFIPCVISTMVTTKMWVNILNPEYGLLNKVLEAVGLGFLQHEWLSDTKTALGSVLIIIIWQGFGMGMLIYYAGLKGISEDMYEAAKIDGATGLKIYTRITLPLLLPVIKVNATLGMIAALKQMETVFLSTNGGPGDATQFIANYLYIVAFNKYQYGYANAISVLFVAICILVTFFYNKMLNSDVGEF